MRSIGRSVRVRSVCKIKYSCYSLFVFKKNSWSKDLVVKKS